MMWWQKKPYIDTINAYEKLSSREKNLVLPTVVIVILLIGYLLFIEPLLISNSVLLEEQAKINEESSALDLRIEETKNTAIEDPNDALREKLDQLIKDEQDKQETINLSMRSIVAPKQMVSLLESVMTEDAKLKLISLKNTPQIAMNISGNGLSEMNQSSVNASDEVVEEALFYKHVFEVELEATYGSALAYLKRLDNVQWPFFWQGLRYETTTYPKGILKIKIYTLSMSDEVLGV